MVQTIIKKSRKTGLYFVEDLGNGVELEMVLIKGGTFTMGAPEDEEDSNNDEFSKRKMYQCTIKSLSFVRVRVTRTFQTYKMPFQERVFYWQRSDFGCVWLPSSSI